MLCPLTWSIQRLRVRHVSQFTNLKCTVNFAIRTMASEAQSISSAPAENQTIVHDGQQYTTVREGRAFILVPETASKDDGPKKAANKAGEVQQVFYNPIQQFNRDLTVLALKAYGEEVVEKRKHALEQRMNSWAGKKRKRQEVDAASRSEKVAKVTDPSGKEPDVTNGAATTHDDTQVNADAVENGAKDGEATTGAQAEGQAKTVTNEMPTADDVQMQDAPSEELAAKREAHPKFTILDALSATGLRALRYAHELPFVTQVTANDLLESAVDSIKLNAQYNKLEDKINVTKGDALGHMYSLIARELLRVDHSKPAKKPKDKKGSEKKASEKYDVIDLDPYGTAATFLDAAVQSVRDDGGLLCVTCTDSGVWASTGYSEKAWALYGGVPMKGSHCHEGGLRLILHAIATSASRYGLAIEPLLSLSIDFYARVFVRIRKSPAAVKFQAGKTMIVYSCDSGCGAWSTQLLLKNKPVPNKNGQGNFYKHTLAQGPSAEHKCEHCGFKTHMAGPMYAGHLHSPEFIQRILDKLPEAPKDVYGTTDRIKGMLTTALEEHLEEVMVEGTNKTKEDELAELDHYPFFFYPHQIAGALHCVTPGEDALRGALRGLGYRTTRSHCKAGSVKTDAPWSVIWDVMREWIRQKAPIKEKNIKPGTAGYALLKLGEKSKAEKSAEKAVEEPAEKAAETVTTDAAVDERENEKKPEVVFDEKLGREKNRERLVRYQMNPRENWGPMNKATGK